MNLQVQEINLDINDNHTYQHLYTKQYDIHRVFKFNIYKDGNPYDISGTEAVFEMKKPDGTVIMNTAEITGTNQVQISLTPQMSIVYGKSTFQIKFIENENVVTTITGKLVIDEAVIQDNDVESSDEFGYITDLLVRIAEYANAAHQSEINAKASEDAAKESELNAKDSEDAALVSELNAKDSEDAAKASEDNAKTSEDNAKDSEDAAKASEDAAKDAETAAEGWADTAHDWADAAEDWAEKAAGNATSIIYDANEPALQDEGGFWVQPYS